MYKGWTDDEVNLLISNWGCNRLEDLKSILNRSEDSIIRKARRLGIDVRKKEEDKIVKSWTSEEDNYLRENYGAVSLKDMSKHLRRTSTSISKRVKFLGIRKNIPRWTEEEEDYLQEMWGVYCIESIAKKLRRTKESILIKAHKLDLRQQVLANGAYLTPNDIADITGINLRTLYSWIREGKIEHKKFRVGKKRKYQIAPESLLKFLENYPDKWNTKEADLSIIKAYTSSYLITSDNNFVLKDRNPKWLEEKIMHDNEKYKLSGKALFNNGPKSIFLYK